MGRLTLLVRCSNEPGVAGVPSFRARADCGSVKAAGLVSVTPAVPDPVSGLPSCADWSVPPQIFVPGP
jgi:hypothetical protein